MNSTVIESLPKTAPSREDLQGKGLIRRLVDIFFGTMMSRVLGFAREVVISAFFGT